MDKRRWLIVGGIALVALSIAAYIYSQFEWMVEEVDSGFSSNAKRKPYLAAFKMLHNSGVKVNYLLGFSIFEDSNSNGSRLQHNDAIVLINAYRMLTPRRTEQILSWVKKGGHLIYSTDSFFRSDDPQQGDHLLDALGVNVAKQSKQNIINFTFNPKYDCNKDNTHVTSVKLKSEKEPIWVGFVTHQQLLDPKKDAKVYVVADSKIKMLQKGLGKGLVSVMTTTTMWNNRQIGCNDQAYFLWYLVGRGNKAWILENISAPSLFDLAWARQPLTIVLFLFLLALWLWRKSSRFSPVIPVHSEDRRQIQEHLRATGKFFWRNTQTEVIVKELVDELMMKIKSKYSLTSITDEEATEIISDSTNLNRNLVKDLLNVKPHSNESEMIDQVKLLKLIRETI